MTDTKAGKKNKQQRGATKKYGLPRRDLNPGRPRDRRKC